MKRLKVIWCLLGFLFIVANANAQSSFTLEASQLYTSFKYTDSQGTSLNSEYSGIYKGAYGLGYRFTSLKGISIITGLGMRKAGATLVYDDMNYTWDLQYADVKLGFGYMFKKSKVRPYFNVSGYYAFLLSGFQTINNEDFDINDSKSLNNTDYGVLITPGVQFKFSDVISSYLEFNYIMGLQNLEKDADQKSANIAYGLTLGISISLSK